jgi:solute carrier family 38 (sodium-coupled neutral amino acid transporter), member 11
MVFCLVLALGGFLTFGDKTLGNVLNNFPADNTMVNIARLCFGLNMLTTLPLEAFVCREVMLTYFFPDEPFNMNRHLLFSTSLVASALVLSLVTCDLGAVFELVGATSAVAMAYILPPLCYMKLTTRSWRTYMAGAVVVFGMIVMVISVIQAVQKMISSEFPCIPSEDPCLRLMDDGICTNLPQAKMDRCSVHKFQAFLYLYLFTFIQQHYNITKDNRHRPLLGQ